MHLPGKYQQIDLVTVTQRYYLSFVLHKSFNSIYLWGFKEFNNPFDPLKTTSIKLDTEQIITSPITLDKLKFAYWQFKMRSAKVVKNFENARCGNFEKIDLFPNFEDA